MSQPTQTDVRVRKFAAELKQVRRHAGDISVRVLAKRSGHSSSTLNRATGGVKFPRWQVVHDYLAACGVDEGSIVNDWRPAWVNIANELRPIDGTEKLTGAEKTNPLVDAAVVRAVDSPVSKLAALVAKPVTGLLDKQAFGQFTVCHICGAVVADIERHEQWHLQFVPKFRSVAS